MGITAKELAARLGLSATAVSMALNNKPGVSSETRAYVLKEAEKHGYDFSKLSMKKKILRRHLLYYLPGTQCYSELFSDLFRTHRWYRTGMPQQRISFEDSAVL